MVLLVTWRTCLNNKVLGNNDMPKIRDLTNEIFGRLRVLEFAGRRRTAGGESKRTWLCVCECGNEKVVDTGALTTGNTTSCGCYDKERRLKHGMYQTRFYQIWEDMKSRCNNPNTNCYHSYGGRGIKYDPRWEDFLEFKADVFESYDDNLTLDRIDPNGDYCKENCKWSTKSVQSRNKTKMVTNKTGVTGVREWVDGKSGTLYYVAEAQAFGKRKYKHFSTLKYGKEVAFKLACEFRDNFISEFNNEDSAQFSEYHGKEKVYE